MLNIYLGLSLSLMGPSPSYDMANDEPASKETHVEKKQETKAENKQEEKLVAKPVKKPEADAKEETKHEEKPVAKPVKKPEADAKEETKHEEKPVKEETHAGTGTLKLEGILKFTDTNWVVWINDKTYSNDNIGEEEFEITAVNPRYITISFPKINHHPINLYANQSLDLSNLKIVDVEIKSEKPAKDPRENPSVKITQTKKMTVPKI